MQLNKKKMIHISNKHIQKVNKYLIDKLGKFYDKNTFFFLLFVKLVQQKKVNINVYLMHQHFVMLKNHVYKHKYMLYHKKIINKKNLKHYQPHQSHHHKNQYVFIQQVILKMFFIVMIKKIVVVVMPVVIV